MAGTNNGKEKQNLSEEGSSRWSKVNSNNSSSWRSYNTQHAARDEKKPTERYFCFHCNIYFLMDYSCIYRDAKNWRKPAASKTESFQGHQKQETQIIT